MTILSPFERDRALAARQWMHQRQCSLKIAIPCPTCPAGSGIVLALRSLDEHPRDIRSVRRILHDHVCMSDCRPDSDHADRTQSKPAAALKKFHRGATQLEERS